MERGYAYQPPVVLPPAGAGRGVPLLLLWTTHCRACPPALPESFHVFTL
jgi:hypothetical protein